MNWALYLLSVGDINNFKLSLAPVKLLLWCWINYWSSPLFFWFCPTHMTPVFSISLVGIIPSLVCIYMIIYTWCGRLNFYLCIPICVDGIYIYVLASLKPPFKEVKKNRSNVFNGLSVIVEFVQMRVFLLLFLSMNPFLRIHALEIFPISCSLDESVLSQGVLLLRDDYVCFETYLL